MSRGRPSIIPALRYAWVLDRASNPKTSFQKLSDQYFAAFEERIHYSTFKRFLTRMETNLKYGAKAREINQQRRLYGNKGPSRAKPKQL